MNNRITPFIMLLSLAFIVFSCSAEQVDESIFEGDQENEATVVGDPLEILVNSMWVLIEFDGDNIDSEKYDSKVPHLLFSSDENRFSGNMGCNQLMGSFSMNDNNFTFSQVASTKMLCPEMELEDAFGQKVDSIGKFQFDQNRLILMDDDKETIAVFEARELEG